MTDALTTFIDQAWTDHADDAAGVALRLPRALDLVHDAAGMAALARLAHHVWGEHLGNWGDLLKFLAALARGPGFDAGSDEGRLLRQLRAGVALAGGQGDVRGTLDASGHAAVTARAAMLLAGHDAPRSQALFDEALALADALPEGDPALRVLAIAGNNAASSLIDRPARSEAERALMLCAAQTGRRFWALAGTWLQTERADYTLARAWLAAGDAAAARRHAQACLALIDAQPEPQALERFFGSEALARAEHAAGDRAAFSRAVADAQAAFDRLPADEQATCAPTLQALQAL